MKNRYSIFAALALLLFAQTFLAQTTVKTAKWKTLKGPKYSIMYPPDWKLDTTGVMGSEFVFLSNLENKEDKFTENVLLMIQDLGAKKMDLNTYVDISEDQVRNRILDGVLIESKRMKGQSGEYHRMIYVGTQGMFFLKTEQYFWVIGNKAYVLTLSCEAKKFDAYKEVGEAILNSFMLER